MFRRRTTVLTAPTRLPAPDDPAELDALAAAGWLLPRSLVGPAAAAGRWTWIGTLDSATATAVDAGGLVARDGWSLDWWIGADDRWHLPAREPAVRQRLVGAAPVVETLVHIPGGDAVHRAYAIRSAGGDEHVVVEIENRTTVPFAVALAVRPFDPSGAGRIDEVMVEPSSDGPSRDVGHVVRIDGRPALLLPRAPARAAVGSRALGDVVGLVTSGAAVPGLPTARDPDGRATMAFVFPLVHTATLRVVLPVDGVAGTAPSPPAVVPDAVTVAAGWDAQAGRVRLDLPDPRLAEAVASSTRFVLLAGDGRAVADDGRPTGAIDPVATPLLLGSLGAQGRHQEVAAVLAAWPDLLAGMAGDEATSVAPAVVAAVAAHWLLTHDGPLLEALLPDVVAAVARLDRAGSGRGPDPTARRLAVRGLHDLAAVLAATGQADAVDPLRRLAGRLGGDTPGPRDAVDPLRRLAGRLGGDTPGQSDAAGRAPSPARAELARLRDAAAAGDRGLAEHLDAVLADASPTGAWPLVAGARPGIAAGARAEGWTGDPAPADADHEVARAGLGVLGHDLAANAALVLAVRSLVVADVDGLVLLPGFLDRWYGGAIDVHDLPTAAGRLSFAVRWHGARPALLWELEPFSNADGGPVRLSAPRLDPAWSTTDLRGDALLGPVEPPPGFEPVTVVAEHPDIDPAVRRPGAPAPDAPPIADEGGTFS